MVSACADADMSHVSVFSALKEKFYFGYFSQQGNNKTNTITG